jgi:VCBS repeat-containing protein
MANNVPVANPDSNLGDPVVEAGVNPGNIQFRGNPRASGNVLTNDADADVGDSKTVTTTGVFVGTYGSLTLAANGRWLYRLDNADSDTNALAQGATVQEVFVYTMVDAQGATSSSTLTIAITGTNDAPAAVADDNAGDPVTESGVGPGNDPFPGDPTASGNVLANDTDADAGDSKTVTTTGVFAGTYGSLTLNADGSWTYTLDNTDSDTNALAQGAAAKEVFVYTIADGHGATSSSKLRIVITGTNDSPLAVADDNAGDRVVEAGVNRGNSPVPGDPRASGNVLTNDTDADVRDSKTVTTTGVFAGTYGSLALAANGRWSYMLDNADSDTNALAQGATVQEVFAYTMVDRHGATSSSTLTIGIIGTNDAPVAVADDNGGDPVTESGVGPGNDPFPGDPTASGNVLANDTDADAGDSKTVTTTGVFTGIYGSLTLAADGGWTYTLDNTDSDTDALAQGAAVQDVFNYTMVDAQGLTSSTTLTIAITGTGDNHAPGANPDDNAGDPVTESGVNPGNTPFPGDPTATGNVLANDAGAGGSKTVTTTGIFAGTYGSLTLNFDGDWTYTLDNTDGDTDALAHGAPAQEVFNYTMADGNGATASSTLIIAISGTNDAPMAVADDNAGDPVVEDGVSPGDPSASGNVLANDTDADAGDSKTVTTAGVFAGTYGSLTLAADGAWTYTLDNADPDTDGLAQDAAAQDVFNYTIRDNFGASSSATLTIAITGTNDAPVAVADDNTGDAVTESGVNPGNNPFPGDGSAMGNVLANDIDPDGETKTVTTTGTFTGTYGTLDLNPDGSWTYTLDNADGDTNALAQGQPVSDVFGYTMRDPYGVTSSSTLTVAIAGTNDAPVAAADTNAGDAVIEAGVSPSGDLTPTPVTGEFLVNTVTGGFQSQATVAALEDGGFVVVWASSGPGGTGALPGGNGYDIHAQRFDAAGNPAGAEFRVNTIASNPQISPAITTLEDGGFVITYSAQGHVGDPNYTLAGQRFDAGGAPVGGEFRIDQDDDTDNGQQFSTVTALAGGGFLVTWTAPKQDGPDGVVDGSGHAVLGRIYDAAGAPVTGEFLINTSTANNQNFSSATPLPDGGFVVTWGSVVTVGEEEIIGQRFDAGGARVGSEFQVNTTTSNPQQSPSMAALADGGFVVTWSSASLIGVGAYEYNIVGQRFAGFDVVGTPIPVGNEFIINTETDNDQVFSSVTALDDGGFVVVWQSKAQDSPADLGVFGQRFDSNGNAAGDEFQINQTTTGDQGFDSGGGDYTVVQLESGDLMMVWQTGGGLGEIFGRRFEVPTSGVNPGEPSASGNVLANDTDADAGDSMTVTTTGTFTGTYGSLTLSADGSWTYTLDNTDADSNALAQGDAASDIFNYSMQDANSATSSSTLTIAITGTNDAPVANPDSNAGDPVVEAGSPPDAGDPTATGNVLTNDTDVDTGDSTTVTTTGIFAGTYGSLLLNADGSWIYTLDNADPDTNGLAEGALAQDVFDYTMVDNFGATASSALTIDITGVML